MGPIPKRRLLALGISLTAIVGVALLTANGPRDIPIVGATVQDDGTILLATNTCGAQAEVSEHTLDGSTLSVKVTSDGSANDRLCVDAAIGLADFAPDSVTEVVDLTTGNVYPLASE